MKKILMLIAPNGFRDEEYIEPKKVFEKNGFQVVTCSDKPGPLTGKRGLVTADVDIQLQNVNIDDYATMVIVGGQPYFWNNPKVLDMVRHLDKFKKPIGAICISGCIPAQAGIMRGRRSTMFPDPEGIREIGKNGGIYTGEDLTVDGNVVTANGPKPAQKFAEEIVKLLK